jgi:uncharacterized membrane protein YphA (DoxX/SURF4 family)
MLMAIAKVHWRNGIWASKGGVEFALTNLAAALALALTGPGLYSLDGVLGIRLPEPLTLIASLVLVILGLLAAFASQAPQPSSQSGATNG